MLMVGFYGTSVNEKSRICKDIKKYNLAGVILFDYNPIDKNKPKNIASKEQLRSLSAQLQACSFDKRLLIALDQEGGKVQRLKRIYGFEGDFPSAYDAAKMSQEDMRAVYLKMAQELKGVGINYDLAPVVDLALNPKNHVIYGLKRSYGADPKEVSKSASVFLEAMNSEGVLTSLKHFPGHGSSLGDTHKGYVNVTKSWNAKELEPYRLLKDRADSVMVSHVFNADIDSKYPATLSKKTIRGLLRDQIGFQGVVITDDLQMGAIAKEYSLEETLKLAIGAGDDILLFGNQLDPKNTISTEKLVSTLKGLIEKGEIDIRDIQEANMRVEQLKSKLP
ncbi:MAG: glycosyl hydrolase [Campylobacterales bacterium]|nr:glycosyl hydrolase [Campylobacterales bacterium]